MNCPKCDVELSMTDRQGIEVDYCPKCRGIWLDRGELDKILARSVKEERDHPYQDRDDDHDRGRYPRRKSWWMELFD